MSQNIVSIADVDWSLFTNHVAQLASIDFFTVPTASFRVLFVFVVLSHDRRRIMRLYVTAHSTAAWTAQQLRKAWPWDTAPRFVIQDHDTIYGSDLRRAARAIGIEEVPTAWRSPWQNPFVERVIGSIRRECLDHMIVWNEGSLRRYLQQFLTYYLGWRTHLAGQGCACPAVCAPADAGTDRESLAPRRSASSLRTSRSLRISLCLQKTSSDRSGMANPFIVSLISTVDAIAVG
jgi:putative transposase